MMASAYQAERMSFLARDNSQPESESTMQRLTGGLPNPQLCEVCVRYKVPKGVWTTILVDAERGLRDRNDHPCEHGVQMPRN